jgi:hypothetical protein
LTEDPNETKRSSGDEFLATGEVGLDIPPLDVDEGKRDDMVDGSDLLFLFPLKEKNGVSSGAAAV